MGLLERRAYLLGVFQKGKEEKVSAKPVKKERRTKFIPPPPTKILALTNMYTVSILLPYSLLGS